MSVVGFNHLRSIYIQSSDWKVQIINYHKRSRDVGFLVTRVCVTQTECRTSFFIILFFVKEI